MTSGWIARIARPNMRGICRLVAKICHYQVTTSDTGNIKQAYAAGLLYVVCRINCARPRLTFDLIRVHDFV